ncbi:hypothetical protein FPV67DRAFT_1591195 [Lyophyllum atratum]|nr:hypothetical protein FPV67DRAFT_1591195 [Lyophyllum atratum]
MPYGRVLGIASINWFSATIGLYIYTLDRSDACMAHLPARQERNCCSSCERLI